MFERVFSVASRHCTVPRKLNYEKSDLCVYVLQNKTIAIRSVQFKKIPNVQNKSQPDIEMLQL